MKVFAIKESTSARCLIFSRGKIHALTLPLDAFATIKDVWSDATLTEEYKIKLKEYEDKTTRTRKRKV